METRTESEFVSWLSATARGLGYANDRQLAIALDIRPSTISRWRTQNLRPSVAHLLRISKVFGIGITPLLALSGHVPPEAVADADVPEPPSPVTETVRRISDAPLNDALKETLSRYWEARLAEERSRVYQMITWFGEVSETPTGREDILKEIGERVPGLAKTDLVTHLAEALTDGLVLAQTEESRRHHRSRS